MRWEDVKKSFPSQWVLIEAVNAHTEGNHRIIEQVSVVESFFDKSKQALKNTLSFINNTRIESTTSFTPAVNNWISKN